MEKTVFEAHGISKQYGPAYALKYVDMKITGGEIYGLVGENGAGKTTLMNIIGGLVAPTSGSFSLFGEKNALDSQRKKIGVLIETPALYPNLSAKDNLSFFCKVYGIKNERRAIVNVLELVSLNYEEEKRVGTYSLGMRQRLGLAVALLSDPTFLVLDEPINGLDPAGIVDVRRILERLAKENGVTILISSHILSELQLLASRIGFMHKGELIQEITTVELLKSVETRICIQTPNAAQTAQMLRDELKIVSVFVTETGEIEIPKECVDIEKLMAFFLQKGMKIDGITLSAPNLENYYMNLIGGIKA